MKNEPVMIMAVIQTGLALVISFGVGLTANQVGAILAFSASVLGLVLRTQVTPNVNIPTGTTLLK